MGHLRVFISQTSHIRILTVLFQFKYNIFAHFIPVLYAEISGIIIYYSFLEGNVKVQFCVS